MESFTMPDNNKNMEYNNVLGIMNHTQNDLLSHNLSNFYLDFPCGVLRCTCEKYPKVIYANNWMFKFMGITSSSSDWKDFIQQNVFFMIPAEERNFFREYIDKVNEQITPVFIEHNVINSQGIKVHLKGWISIVENSEGQKEYAFLYVNFPKEQISLNKKREKAYFKMLENIYDGIFKIERQNKIIECLHVKENINNFVYFVKGVRVVVNNTFRNNFLNIVCEEDRTSLKKFFDNIIDNIGLDGQSDAETQFHILKDGVLRKFTIVASEIDEQIVLLCCRKINEEKLVDKNIQIMKYIDSLNKFKRNSGENFYNNILAYKVLNEKVYLQNSDGQYIKHNGESLSEFLEREHISEREYQIAITQNEVVLGDIDCGHNRKRHLYVMKPDNLFNSEQYFLFLYELKETKVEKKPRVIINTFGYFDVFVDGKPIVFHSEKSKEMLAIMVDRKGSFVGNQYLISCIWGDEPYSEKIQNRCRQTVFRLMETLKQYGIENIIEKVDGRRRIIPEMVDCDYFNYIKGEKKQGNSFNGSYMSDYSWGETTLSTLLMD